MLSEHFQNPYCRNISKTHDVGTFPKSNIKTVERGKNDTSTPNTQIHDRSLSSFGTWTPINSGGVKLILLTQTYLLSEMILS